MNLCSTHQNPHCSKYITTFQKTIRLVAEHSLIWHFRLPIKTLLASQRNQIYSEASSTHFSAINLSSFTLYSSKSLWFQIDHYISENYQTCRGTQFNLTLSITNQNTSRLSTQSNIFWSIFNTLLAINLSWTYALLIKILIVLNTSLHFRKLSDLSRNTV